MNPYIENLKQFLESQVPNYGYDDADSLLQMLYYYYTVANPVDNAEIRCRLKSHDRILNRLTIKEQDTLFNTTSGLCTAYERQAFLDGIHVGLRLFTELSDLPG